MIGIRPNRFVIVCPIIAPIPIPMASNEYITENPIGETPSDAKKNPKKLDCHSCSNHNDQITECEKPWNCSFSFCFSWTKHWTFSFFFCFLLLSLFLLSMVLMELHLLSLSLLVFHSHQWLWLLHSGKKCWWEMSVVKMKSSPFSQVLFLSSKKNAMM